MTLANQILEEVTKPRNLATGTRLDVHIGGVLSQEQIFGILLLGCHSRPRISSSGMQIGP